jgi:hypothetical protein
MSIVAEDRQTIEEGVTAPSDPTEASTSRRPKRKTTHVLQFECTCGALVLENERNNSTAVVQCSRQGCETVWVSCIHFNEPNSFSDVLKYHIGCLERGEDFSIRNWVCSTCKKTKKRRGWSRTNELAFVLTILGISNLIYHVKVGRFNAWGRKFFSDPR